MLEHLEIQEVILDKIIIIVLSILALLEFMYILRLSSRIAEDKKDVEDAKKEFERTKNALKREISNLKKSNDLLPGDRVTFEEDLQITKTQESFQALYEATVLDVSDNKIKVDPYEASPVSVNWPASVDKKSVLQFYKGKWVNRSKISPILTESDIREKKLSEILQ